MLLGPDMPTAKCLDGLDLLNYRRSCLPEDTVPADALDFGESRKLFLCRLGATSHAFVHSFRENLHRLFLRCFCRHSYTALRSPVFLAFPRRTYFNTLHNTRIQ